MDTARFQSKVVSRIARTVGVSLGAIALLATLANTSSAIPLAAGSSVFSMGEADPTGGVSVISLTQPFVAATFSGKLTSEVLSGDPDNPWVLLGGLTFTYLIENDASSPHAIGRLTIDDFSGFLTDVNFQTPVGAGVAPAFFDRSSGAGDVVGFTFFGAPVGAGQIAAGSSSAKLVIQTSSTVWRPTTASIIDGSVATAASFAPIPEPSTLVLGGLGLVGLAAFALRRRTSR